MSWRSLLDKHKADLRHAVRLAAAAAVSFALATAFRLPQGYWAVITATVVVQTSIGATLGASRDRLIGTGAGALVGAFAAWARPQTHWGEAAALGLSVGGLSLAAALRPSLKIAPVTAVIMIVGSAASRTGFVEAAGLRVVEIALGGVIGVLVALFVFPARARDAVSANAQAALADLSRLLVLYAQRLEGQEVEAAVAPLHAKIRARLGTIETQVAEASREAAVRLTGAGVADSIPLTLWRLRNDAVMIGRATSRRWGEPEAQRLGGPAAAVLRSQALRLDGLTTALAGGVAALKLPPDDSFAAFRDAFHQLERAREPGGLTFERLERIFGLAFALEAFTHNAADLADRVVEFSSGARE